MSLVFKKLSVLVKDVSYLYQFFKWMLKQRNQPRPVGTVFKKVVGNKTITYEVVAHTLGNNPIEVLEEVHNDEGV